ncbi:unannotated protein [freshwater metagenome]|uniref:Unannotated protein n=1 Tax=freshwater metagenome TaxID=449393 RepID=A0A6J6X5P3_9ZZZZ
MERGSEPLFIVDNADGGRNGVDYLTQWCELAHSFDIATGYFEVSALTSLDGEWQKLKKIRILMGDEVSARTKQAILDALRRRAAQQLDEGLEDDKSANPFLNGVSTVIEAIKEGRIECRVYNRGKFHAKAYITHGKFDVVGSQALVGSSNFTRPGLTQNVELNIKIESSSEVAQLQDWYESYWNDAVDVSDDILRVIQRHTAAFTPFDVWARALHEMFSDIEPTASDWEQHHSTMFPILDRYQQEAYWAMVNIARQHGGAFLCDGVGLGKTFVGLMLIERLVRHEKKNVVLFAPKSTKEGVWEPELKRYLSALGGGLDFSSVTVFSHTDLTREGGFPERFARVAALADAVVIDEAHHFRNPGRAPKDDWADLSRYHRLAKIIKGPDGRPKPVYMLTATPINNSLHDFRHLIELFADDNSFAQTLGVNSLMFRINQMTKALKQRIGEDGAVQENLADAQGLLSDDPLFSGLVVQRSRSYARKSQLQQTGSAASFPVREDPKVAAYSVRKSYGQLLDLVDAAFKKTKPLFALPMYYPLAYYIGADSDIDPIEENRQTQVVGLIRTNFLKRFESSVYAFERSCDRLLRKLLAFVQKNLEGPKEQARLDRWMDQHASLLSYTHARQLELWGTDWDDDQNEDEDVIPPELLEAAEKLPHDEYRVAEVIAETFLDMNQLVQFLEECRRFRPQQDDKLQRLIKLLKSKEADGHKVLIFTEFADTARYLRKHLVEANIDGVTQIDSGSKTNRADVLRRFSPYYNGSSSGDLISRGEEEIRILVATDVLSEGLNLQDATRLVNYDIHWNPVRLMQRIGRVDRRLNPETEKRLVADHPQMTKDRGKIKFWNFLPPDELDDLLRLYRTVSHKAITISRTLGIEGKKFLTPDDDYEALQEFNVNYEGETSAMEELHLEYQKLLIDDADLEQRLAGLPFGIFSGRERGGETPAGVFMCLRLPALDTESDTYTLEAGITRWYYSPLDAKEILEDTAAIAEHVRTQRGHPRRTIIAQQQLIDSRDRILKHVKNTYLKQIGAPVSAPKPQLVCWMEINS